MRLARDLSAAGPSEAPVQPAEPLQLQPALSLGFTRHDALVALLLALLTFLIFLPATRYDFVNFDDYPIIRLNDHVTRGLTVDGVRWAFTNLDQGAYFPLTWLSFQLDAQLYGLHAGGYHLTNILLHAANAAVLFWFLRLASGSRWRSAAVSAIFAVHPLRVESVVWVTERKDVLCGFSAFSRS